MTENMIERLRALSISRMRDTALVTVDANGETRYDYAELDRRARVVGARLRLALDELDGRDVRTAFADADAPPRVLLLMDSGIDYVASFFGCLYAGVIAVPAYPPESLRAQHLSRLESIAADAGASVILTTASLVDKLHDAFAAIAPRADVIAVDAAGFNDIEVPAFEPYRANSADVAFLQYTSGSTSAPKGVMVTHGSLWANELAIREGLGVRDDDVFVSWLPLYHDMGLIGTLSQPVFSGIPLVLMSPQHFLERPVRWLEAIARHRGTISGGPDFAYRLCADRVSDEQRAALDLSTWRVAFSGSEPVRKTTLDAFAARFEAVGFDPQALFPCYGLAEATLYVSGVARGNGARASSFAVAPLADGRAEPGDDGTPLVSCGKVANGHALAIVDRTSGAALDAGEIGEILIRGPSVAAGYWRRPEDTANAFVERGGLRWLRTGDLGFLRNGELYVSGRIKDLLIVRGRNLYPQDLEQVIEREVELVRRGRVAAFAVELDAQEGIGIAAEVSRNVQKLVPAEAIAAALSEAIALACGEPASAVVLLNPAGLPKTSSGKVQRAACARGWEQRSLDAYACFANGRRVDEAALDSNAAMPLDTSSLSMSSTASASMARATPRAGIEQELATLWCNALRLQQEPLTREDSFFALGGNSLAAVQVAASARMRWDVDYAIRDVFAAPVLKDAAALIEHKRARGIVAHQPAMVRLPDDQRRVTRASDAQRGLWLTWHQDTESAAYNMSGELHLSGDLDVPALQRAFADLVRRHEILRAHFALGDDGEPLQIIEENVRIPLLLTRLDADSSEQREAALDGLIQQVARQPFDLERGPLLRAHLVCTGSREYRLLLALHHIIADGWSVNVLLTSLAEAYRLQRDSPDEVESETNLLLQYADYVAWDRESLDSDAISRQLDYWRNQLAADGDPAASAQLFTPSAWDIAGVSRLAGRQQSLGFALPAQTTEKLKRFGRPRRATLFMTMLAILNVVLQRLSGKDDIRVGAPLSLRKRPEAQSMVGYFINLQVLRTRMSRHRTFDALVDAVRETVLAAQDHQDVPFDQLVSALQPNRGKNGAALFQVKLTEQQPFVEHAFEPLDAQLHVLLNEAPHFDLALDFTDTGAALDCLLAYDDGIFDAGFAARFAEMFVKLAAQLVDAPEVEWEQHGWQVAPASHAFEDLQAVQPSLVSEISRELLDASTLSGNRSDYDAHDVLALWDTSVARCPTRVALRDGERSVTFSALDAAADALAAQLDVLGVRNEARVGVLAGRSIEQVLGMLAAFKAGATWVPFDPQIPVARIAAQIADSSAVALLHVDALPAGLAELRIDTLTLRYDPNVLPEKSSPPSISALRTRTGIHADSAAYTIYTSGSTGEPKGVVITHRALANYVQGMLATLNVDDDASFAMASTPAADLGHTVLFGALCSGRTLHLLAQDLAFNPDGFARYVSEHRIGVLKIVPSHLSALLSAADPRDVLPSQALIVGGEATSAALLERLRALDAPCRIFNHYGPTETTVGIAMHVLADASEPGRDLPLGAPLPNARIYLLDECMEPVAPGAEGELYLGGPGVARGYHGRAGLTAARFVPDPLVAGARLYRSGDRGRRAADGWLEYLGRVDDQIKVRGYRVEPGEVERALLAVDGVREAAVLAYDSASGKRLAAFVVSNRALDAVCMDAARTLPDYMTPAEAIALDALPLNANGKVDRAALRVELTAYLAAKSARANNVNHVGASGNDNDDAPHSPAESALAQIWANVLGIEAGTIERGQNFFEVGGDSILGLKVVAKARKAGWWITPKQLFERKTLAELARQAEAKAATGEREDQRQTSIRRLPDAARTRTEASYAQQRQWFMWQLAPQSSAYHVAGGLWLTGAVDAAALRASLEAIVARHEVLRTRFAADDETGRVEQWIDAQARLDWREQALPAAQIDAAARALASEPFDLANGPLLRAGLYRSQNGRSLLVLALHHIVSDGWSVQVLLEELVAHYRARVLNEPLINPALPVQYADYAAWQREWLEAGEREKQLKYWREALGETQPVLALPTDAPRQAHASYRAGRYAMTLPRELAQAIRERAQRDSTTPFTVLLAAFQTLLYRYTGEGDIRVGVPVANRNRVETEPLIGFFVNTQVLRSRIDGSTTPEALLSRVRKAAEGAQAHQELPFDVLVDALRPERSLSHTPLFQVMFNHQRRDWRVLQQLPDLSIEPYRLPGAMAQFELMLDTREEENGNMTLEFTYAQELFHESTVQRMARHYQRLLEAFSTATGAMDEAVDAITLTDDAERATLASWSRNSTRYVGYEPVFRAFERRAAAYPDDEALLFDNQILRYGQLNSRANQLARWLRAQGVGVESRVGVAANRSLEMVIALYAVMKAGAAYVPLDPSYPSERLAYMTGDSGIDLLLSQRDVAMPEVSGVRRVELESIDATSHADTNLDDVLLHGANLAYVIYTSGSTGRPKGVGNRHDALWNRLVWMQRAYELKRGETVLQKTPFSFDVSVWEFFWPLMVGARLAIAAPGAHRDPERLAAAICDYRVSTLHFVPSMLQAFIASGHASRCGEELVRVICSGEALSADLQARVSEALPKVSLHNLYGPTEAAIDVTEWTCIEEGGRPVPIGRPIAATQTWVLDERMEPVPQGVPGELYLGGAGLARGYLGRPALTAESFVPSPFDSAARLYRTGDLVRWRADGALDYLGRLDHQVKIRGFRIELGEIEAALTVEAGVREAVVIAHDGKLIGYVAGESVDAAVLRSRLSKSLPDYMVPWRIVPLAAMPLNANGKVDRQALPKPSIETASEASWEPPRAGMEARLAAIWAALLGAGRISRHDDFFALGGHSLLAVRLNARIALELKANLPLATLFEAATLHEQAAAIERVSKGEGNDDALRGLDLFIDTL